MANPQLKKMAVPTVASVCNAESPRGPEFVSKESVISILARQRAAFELLTVSGGLSPASPSAFKRERWEIVAGKLLALDTVADQIRLLTSASPSDLMGEKPSSLLSSIRSIVARRRDDAHETCLFVSSSANPSGPPPIRWTQSDAVFSELSSLLDELAERFPGNAEEQPGPREESPPLIGAIPMTAAAANPPTVSEFDLRTMNLGKIDTGMLSDFSELILDELDRRGSGARWNGYPASGPGDDPYSLF